MGKKRKRKKRSNVTDLKAIYNRGMQLYLEEENYIAGLKYLYKAAKVGYKKAYGEIGIILHREKNEADEAEEWFKKAEDAGCLHAPHAYDYGMLLIKERGDIERGNRYLIFLEFPLLFLLLSCSSLYHSLNFFNPPCPSTSSRSK
jgi:hypothetical protein